MIDVDNSRLNESTISLRMSVWVEWWEYNRSQLLFLILKSSAMIRILFKFTSISFRYFKAVC